MPARPIHVPVMPDEVLQWLAPPQGGCVVDGTVGGGGHASRIAERIGSQGHLIGLDRDPEMIELARARLGRGETQAAAPSSFALVTLVHASFGDLREVLDALEVAEADGVLLDLGVCSDQLASEGRGFSFHDPGPLDLRFDRSRGEPAHRMVNRYSAERLAEVFWRWGEERHARRIAKAIVQARRRSEIVAAQELAEIVYKAVPPPARRRRIHPATRVFQALRIAVNNELDSLARALKEMPRCVRDGGRLVVISFHSLEDRLVKQALRDKSHWEVLTRRPVRPSEAEVRANPRARSAKLRAGRKHTPDGA
jgi:16S rRNA (cytosine1402-N4)-methyltransferase